MTAHRRAVRPAIERGEPVSSTLPIRNVNRTVGTMLGHEITKRHGAGLPRHDRGALPGIGRPELRGLRAKGITCELTGDANDYVGKGLSGGKIVIARQALAVRGRGTSSPATWHPLRRHQRRGVPARRGRVSASACATRVRSPSSKASATTPAST
jgi:glutamate synthase (NADPH) large chain